MSRFAASLTVLLVLGVCACGGDSAPKDVAKVYNSFTHDVVSSDFPSACGLMTKEAQAQVVTAGKTLTRGVSKTCSVALESTMQLVDDGDLTSLANKATASDVTVKGDAATVKAHGNTSRFERRDGDWLISAER